MNAINLDYSGLKVCITRPVSLADSLVQKLEGTGCQVFLLPALEIISTTNTKEALAIAYSFSQLDLIIFISPSAVRNSVGLLPHDFIWPENVHIAAMGKGTKEQLESFGVQTQILPPKEFSSHGLLEHAYFQNITHKNILVIKGVGGNPYLTETLRKAGAHVKEWCVYERCCPRISADKILNLMVNDVEIFIATSQESLLNLEKIMAVSTQGVEWLKLRKFVVISPRMVEFACQRNYHHVIAAADASEKSLIEAIGAYR